MKIRNKITLIIITTMILLIFFSNIAFESFFSNYLESQEDAQVNSIKLGMESFFYEKKNKYQGSVNDLSHWDDTYDLMNNNYPTFIEENLGEDTFVNLELNFVIIVGKDNEIKSKQFYDFDSRRFTEFPHSINDDIEKVILESKSKEDTSCVLKLGDEFYFVATSEITDSNKEEDAIGRMIFGKLIDKNMIASLEKIADSKISFSAEENISVSMPKENAQRERGSISLQLMKLQKEKDNMLVELVLPKSFHEERFILIKIIKTRNLFIDGMNQVVKFKWIYAQIMIFISLFIFALLGRYISKPFSKLICEVKGLDLTKSEIEKLKAYGKDEFAFLRNSINSMLSRIELEQFKVRENKDKLYATLTSVGDGVIAVDRNGIVTFINPVAEQLTGWGQEEAYGKPFETIFKIINEYTREAVDSPVQKVFNSEETIELGNHTILISKNGYEKAIEDTAAPIKDRFGKVIGAVLVFRDFSEKKEKQRQIEFLSYHDQLTGLYNRRFWEEELTRLDTSENLPLSIVFADVNGLKTINDAFGHQYGDILLQQVSEVFKTEFRSNDIISRTGGDEFIILLPKTEATVAKNLVIHVKEEIEKKVIMNINASVSFGCDTKNQKNQSTWNVLKNAEDLMYQRKIFDSSSKRSEVIKSILNTLHLKTPRENAHSKRVSVICEAIGQAYNLSKDEIKELSIAGELHDIGKIAVDEVVLNKPGKLSEAEWAQIQRHPETGYRLLGTSSEYYNIAEYVLAHHEKWDGTGYPKRLKGEDIPWKARIISIADSYDAMTCERPYRKPLTQEEAVEEIKKSAGKQFDPDIARTFVEKVLGMTW